MKVLIFGAGRGGKRFYNNIKCKNDTTVIAFIDNNTELIGKSIDGVQIINPSEIVSFEFEKIIITTLSKYAVEIYAQLRDMGIAEDKIEYPVYSDAFGYNEDTDTRVVWLRNFSMYVQDNSICGSVAECGVHRGHFARYINKYFPDRTIYLFDTFDGFPTQDVEAELSLGNGSFNNSDFALNRNYFTGIDIERVMQYMPHREKCVVKKGVFPETAVGIGDSFCFVNLDMNLYQPMLAALNFFWDKMTCGGIILLHDYYHQDLPGVAKAVGDFEKSEKRYICKTPIGDFCSMALIKD